MPSFENINRALYEKNKQSVLDSLALDPGFPPLRWRYYLALLLSVLPFMVVLAAGAGAAYFLLRSKSFILSGIFLFPVLLLAFISLPRSPRPKRGALIFTRARRVELFQEMDRLSGILEAPFMDLLVIDDEFNASYSITGLGRKRTLTLGLPLILVMSDAELGALLCHELAHAKNPDPFLGLFIGSGLRSLQHAEEMLVDSFRVGNLSS